MALQVFSYIHGCEHMWQVMLIQLEHIFKLVTLVVYN